MTGIGCGHNLISSNIFLNHSASLPAAAKAMNSDSIVEWVILVYFFDAQETTSPPKMNTHPEVDLLSLALVIQLASV